MENLLRDQEVQDNNDRMSAELVEKGGSEEINGPKCHSTRMTWRPSQGIDDNTTKRRLKKGPTPDMDGKSHRNGDDRSHK